jgi:TolB protein
MEPIHSPDETKIAYRVYGGDSSYGDIWIMDNDGSNRIRLTTNPDGDKSPDFSPDCTKIVYVSGSIRIMNSDGSDKKRLTDDDWYYDEPSFTPDGRILYISARVSPHSYKIEDGNIWMMDEDGGNQILIVPTRFGDNVYNSDPSISPDGTKIIFNHGLGGTRGGFYYIEDPTGEWNDSDGDGVWDGIDGAPDDPDEGYIKDSPLEGGPCSSIIIPAGMIMATVCIKRRGTRI